MRIDDDLKYFEEPEFKDILAKYEAAREAGTPMYMGADELTDVAEYYSLVMHDEERASEAIELALEIHPSAVDPQVFLARRFMMQGDLDKAQEICNAIEEQANREVLFLHAELMLRRGNEKEAFSFLDRRIEEIDEDRDFFIYDSAYIFVDYHLYDLALTLANKLAEMAPDWYKTWQLQADVNLGLGNNRVALDYIEKMLDVDPFDVENWNWRAEAYSALGTYEKAFESTEYALAIEPHNERALQLKAWVLMQQGNTSEAHHLYQRLEEMNPDCESHWLYDSYCLLDAEQVEQSRALIERAMELADGNSVDQQAIYEQYAQVLSRMGDANGALRQLDLAESCHEDNEWDERMLRARVYAENGDMTSFDQEVERQMNLYPDKDIRIYYQAALILFDYGYYERTFCSLEHFGTDEGPEDLQAAGLELFSYLAYSALEIGHNDEALYYLRKSIDAGDAHLQELFAEKFPNVRVDELYDYVYYQLNGRWPE